MKDLYDNPYDDRRQRLPPKPEPTLKEQMAKLTDVMEDLMVKKGSAKRFKLPMNARINKAKIKRKFASILYLDENRGVRFLRVPIDEGTIMVDGVPHLASPDYVLNYKNKPFLIVPSWSAKPFSPEENYAKTVRDGLSTHGFKLLLNKMKKDAIMAKKKVGGMSIIIIVAVAIGGYYLYSSGAFGG